MLNAIINNPFRILGVYANASEDEITNAYYRLTENPSAKCATDFPIENLPIPCRDTNSISAAKSICLNPQLSVCHKLFWFMIPPDNKGIHELKEGDLESSREYWFAATSKEAEHNGLVSLLIDEEYGQVALEADRLLGIQQYRENTLRTKENYQTLIEHFKSLLFDESNASGLPSNQEGSWARYVQTLISKELSLSIYNEHLQKAKSSVDPANPSSLLNALKTLFSWQEFRALRQFADKSELQYKLTMQEVTNNAQQWIETYLSQSHDLLKRRNIHSYATSFSVYSNSPIQSSYMSLIGWAYQKCSEFTLPFEVGDMCYSTAYKLIHYYQTGGNANSSGYKRVIEQVAPAFIELKRVLSQEDILYKKLANFMSEIGLTIIEKELTGNLSDLAIANAGSVICYIDRVIDSKLLYEKIKARRDSSMNVLWGLGLPTPKLMSLMSWDSSIFLGDDDSFRQCTSLRSCQSYLRRYPNGKHVNEVQQLIEANDFKPVHQSSSRPTSQWADKKPSPYPQTTRPVGGQISTTNHAQRQAISIDSVFKFILIALIIEFISGLLFGAKPMLIIGLVLAYGYLLTIFGSDLRIEKSSSSTMWIYIAAQTVVSVLGLVLIA